MSAALVVEVCGGAHLLWVQSGLMWRSDRVRAGPGYTPWERVTDLAPGLGGRVLTDSEVARLVAPEVKP